MDIKRDARKETWLTFKTLKHVRSIHRVCGSTRERTDVYTHDFIEDGCVVVDVRDGDLEGADIVELWSTVVSSKNRQVDLLLASRLVAIVSMSRPYQTGLVIDIELELFAVRRHETVCNGSCEQYITMS